MGHPGRAARNSSFQHSQASAIAARDLNLLSRRSGMVGSRTKGIAWRTVKGPPSRLLRCPIRKQCCCNSRYRDVAARRSIHPANGSSMESGCIPNSLLFLTWTAWLQLKPAGTSTFPAVEPISQSSVLREPLTQSGKHGGADSLLLATKVVLK